MDHQAHGLDLNHRIFNAPHKATFAFTDAKMEPQYASKTSVLYPKGMGESLRLTSFENDYAASFTAVPYTKSSEAVPTTPVVM